MNNLTEISVINLSKQFNNYWVLKDTDLRIQQDRFYSLVGPNGAGKTTFLRMLAGASRPSYGKIIFKAGTNEMSRQEWQKQITYMGHDIAFYMDLDASENLKFFTRLAGHKTNTKSIKEALSRVGLKNVHRLPVRYYSRGMGQRLAIARLVLLEPKFLLLDEPLTGLDTNGRELLFSILAEQKKQSIGAIVVSHQPQLFASLSDYSLSIIDSTIEQSQ